MNLMRIVKIAVRQLAKSVELMLVLSERENVLKLG